MDRLISQKSGISGERINRADLSEKDWEKIYTSTSEIVESKIFIDDDGSKTMEDITSSCRKIRHKIGLDMVVVDYLQIITPERNYRGNREQEISQIADGLKKLAKALDVPVIVASQLSRGVENRMNNKPRLADLRESGAIEQNADEVVFVYRPEYYGKTEVDGQDTIGVAKLIVAKHRKGRTGEIDVKFEAEKTNFVDF